MKRLMAFGALMFAGSLWAGFADALDCPEWAFTTGGDAEWIVQTQDVYHGASAVQSGPISDGQSTFLQTTVSGPGLLTFRWKVSSESGYDWLRVAVDGVDYDSGISGTNGAWDEKSVLVLGEGTHVIRWVYSKDGSATAGEDCGKVDALAWTQAPESITVSFDANGGSVDAESRVYAPGDTYGRGGDDPLPTPTRTGFVFLGWVDRETAGSAVTDNQPLPYHDVVLVAKWGQSVSALATTALTAVRTGGESLWYAADAEPGLTAEAFLSGKGGGCGSSNCSPEAGFSNTTNWLQMTVTGPGYFSFDWMIEGGKRVYADDCSRWSNSYVELAFLLDGNDVDDLTIWGDGASDWETKYIYVPSGRHVLKWIAAGRPSCLARPQEWDDATGTYNYSYAYGSKPRVHVANLSFEPARAQPDLPSWADKAVNYTSWRVGDLNRFAAAYGARILADPADYEARILHAVATLGVVAENPEFQKYAQTFGFTFDYARFAFTGARKLNAKTGAVNTLADRALALGAPAIKKALVDLEGIPEDWTGTVTLSSEVWPIDSDVDIDRADVLFARAGLQAALASLNYLAAYDLTVDWTKAGQAATSRTVIPTVKTLPVFGDAAGWSRGLACRGAADKEDGAEGIKKVWALRSGSKLAFYCENSYAWDDVDQVHRIHAEIEAGKRRVCLEAAIFGESGEWKDDFYSTQTNVSCWAWEDKGDWEKKIPASVAIRGTRLLVTFNCSSIKGFSATAWSLGDGEVLSGRPNCEEYCNGSYCWVIPRGLGTWSRNELPRIAQRMRTEQTLFFSKVRDAARLGTARDCVARALDLALEADAAVRGRADDDGLMHFIEYEAERLDLIDFARDNTERARKSLRAPETVDCQQVKEDYYRVTAQTEKDFDFTLLPDNGVMRIYLGALFEGRLTRDLLPATRVNAYGELVPNFDTLRDPTVCGLLPDMTIDNVTNIVARYYSNEVDHAVWVSPDALAVPGTRVVRVYEDYKGYVASGLPKGWTWNKTTGTLTGTATTTFTMTLTRPGRPAVKLKIGVASKPALLVFAEDANTVSVKGTGYFAAGTKVTVTAAVKAGYAFAGWFTRDTDELVATGARYSFKMPAGDCALEARTIPLEEDGLMFYEMANDVDLPLGVPVANDFGIFFDYWSGSPVSMSAKGLPTGLALVRRAEDQAWVLSGIPRKRGLFTATFTAKNAGGYTGSCVIRFWVGMSRTAEKTAAGIDLSALSDCWQLVTGEPFAETFAVPPSRLKSSPVKAVSVKNLPVGLKAAYAAGTLTLSGLPTQAGLFNVAVTVTYADRTTAVSTQSVFVHDSGSCYLPVSVIRNDPAGVLRGKVGGGGVQPYGSIVKLEARPADAKRHFFAGWFLDEAATKPIGELFPSVKEHRKAAVSVRLTSSVSSGTVLYARFLTRAEDRIGLSVETDYWRVSDAAATFPVMVESGSLPKLSATGLPAGTAVSGTSLVVSKVSALKPGTYSATLTAKNASGNAIAKKITVFVPNQTTAVEKGVLKLDTSDEGYTAESYAPMQAGVRQSFTLADLGIAAAKGWTLSLTGLPPGWSYNARTGTIAGTATKAGRTTVTFTVQKGRTVYKATATFDLAGLPGWVAGDFVGATLTNGEKPGTIQANITSAGRITGSYVVMGTKTSFAGSGFAYDEETGSYTAKVTGKVGGVAKTFVLVVRPDVPGVCSPDDAVVGRAHFSGTISSREKIASVRFDHVAEALPKIAENLRCSFDWYGSGYSYSTGTLSLRIGGQGVVTCAFATPRGTVTGSARVADLVYDDACACWRTRLVVGVAPNAQKRISGCYCIVELSLGSEDEAGALSSVTVSDESGNLRVWSFGYEQE